MTHNECLEVFIIVQNLAGIAAVALMVRKFEYFARLASTCLSLQKCCFGASDPQIKCNIITTPKGTSLHRIMCMTCRSSKSVKWLQRYSDLSFFKIAAVRHHGFMERILGRPTKSSWIFSIFCTFGLKTLIPAQKCFFCGVWPPNKEKYQSKNQSNGCWDIVIHQFFSRWRPSAVLDMWSAF